MNTSTIRQRLYEYIKVADDKKVKAIYTIVESEINEMNEWWNDENFIAELDKRTSDLKSGKDQGVTWEELKKEFFSQTPNGL
ncbi:MAG: addiction module protein [Bacteroidota bacterium]|nr:addiction module protein [Bacteroidota bacterium]